MSFSRKQRDLFMDHVYRTLRAYQDGALKGDSTAIGQLDQRLTAVFDRIKSHVPMCKGKKR